MSIVNILRGWGTYTAQTEMGSVGIPNKGKDVRYQVMDVRTLETKNVAIV